MTAVKSLLYLIVEAGLFALYIPLTFLRTGPGIEIGIFALLAIPFWLTGIWIVLWCFRDFTIRGRGTPLPSDPPKELVTSGLYQYVRNPIYVGALMIFLGYFLWFGTWALLMYAVFSFMGVHAFVVFYEEPNLKRRFGRPYEEYLQRVPRWIPHWKKIRLPNLH